MFLKDNAVTYMTRQLWRYARGNRRAVVLYFLLFVAANAIVLLEPLLVAKILNTIQQAGVTQENLWQILGFLALFIVLPHSKCRMILKTNFGFIFCWVKHAFFFTVIENVDWFTSI